MQEKILRTRLHFYGSHATLNLMNAFCLSYCLRSPCLSVHSALHAEALYFIFQIVIEFLNVHGLFAIVFLNMISNGSLFFAFYPKLSFGHVSCHTTLKLSLYKPFLQIICSVLDPLKGFVLNYTVKLFLSGIKSNLFSSVISFFVFNCNASFLTALSVILCVCQLPAPLVQFPLCIVVAVALDLWFTENCNVDLSFLKLASCVLCQWQMLLRPVIFFPPILFNPFIYSILVCKYVTQKCALLYWKKSPKSYIVCYCTVSVWLRSREMSKTIQTDLLVHK